MSKKLIIHTRRLCATKDCSGLGRIKGSYKGKRAYGKWCDKCHRFRTGLPNGHLYQRGQIPNDKCESCGWDKAYCDRHRIVKELGYARENVIVLCPNCHRVESFKEK